MNQLQPIPQTYQHLLILADANTLPPHGLDVLQTAENLMLNLENDLDAESSTLLDREGLVLELFERTRGRQLNHDVVPAFHLQGEGLDDALPRVIRVAEGRAGVQSQGSFPAVQGFVVLVLRWDMLLA